MTATAAAPDTNAEERWQQYDDRLERVRQRLQVEMGAAIAAIDTCLARLGTLRQDLADHPWTPHASPVAAESPAARHGTQQPGRPPPPAAPAMKIAPTRLVKVERQLVKKASLAL